MLIEQWIQIVREMFTATWGDGFNNKWVLWRIVVKVSLIDGTMERWRDRIEIYGYSLWP